MPREHMTVCVQRGEPGEAARVFLYRVIHAGVCGPFSEPVHVEVPDGDYSAVDEWVRGLGYVRTEPFPTDRKLICEATVVRVA
jgi:hypothetical protein